MLDLIVMILWILSHFAPSGGGPGGITVGGGILVGRNPVVIISPGSGR